MKRYGKLWEKLITKENFELAYRKSKKNKGKFKAVVRFEKNWEKNLEKVRQSVINREFHTGEYKEKVKYEPKKRLIYVLPYCPDRIVQHALMNVLMPIFEKQFIKDSYACIKGRGQHKGSIRCMDFVRRNKYCLKCDIKKFYPSINQAILMKMIERKIKDKNVLWLISDIVFSFKGGKNAPIGNLTSQWFGNFYMTPLDRYVKEVLKCKDYERYSDDFCLFSNDKKYLQDCKEKIRVFIKEQLDLEFSKCDVFHTKQGVDYLGYRHFDNYKLVRKRTAKRTSKRMRTLPEMLKSGKITVEHYEGSVASANGVLKHANTYNLRKKIGLEKLQKEIENERRKRKEQQCNS